MPTTVMPPSTSPRVRGVIGTVTSVQKPRTRRAGRPRLSSMLQARLMFKTLSKSEILGRKPRRTERSGGLGEVVRAVARKRRSRSAGALDLVDEAPRDGGLG